MIEGKQPFSLAVGSLMPSFDKASWNDLFSRIFEPEENSRQKLPSEHSISLLYQPNHLMLTAAKTQSAGFRFLLWMANTHTGGMYGSTALQCMRGLLMLGTPSQRAKRKMDQTVNSLSGSPHLTDLMHAAAAPLAQVGKQAALSMHWHAVIDEFLNKEHHTLEVLADALLPIFYLNIAKYIKKKEQVGFPDIVYCFAKVINTHLPEINSRIPAIEAMEDNGEKKAHLTLLFIPIVNDILSVILPQGVHELPLLQISVFLNSYFWEEFKKEVLPQMGVSIYRKLADSLKVKEKEMLLATHGGDSLVALAATIGKKMSEIAPYFLINGGGESPDCPIIVAEIIEVLHSAIKSPKALQQKLNPWIIQQFDALGKSTHPDTQALWNLVGLYVETLLIHVFFHLSKTSTFDDEPINDHALGVLALKFLSACYRFVAQHGAAIEEILAQTKSEEAKSHNAADQDLETLMKIKYFEEFTTDMLQLLGLHDPEKLPLPSFVQEIVANFLRKMIYRFIINQYLALRHVKKTSGLPSL